MRDGTVWAWQSLEACSISLYRYWVEYEAVNVSAGREYPQPTFDVTPFRPSYPVPFYTENFNEGFFFFFLTLTSSRWT